MAEEVSAASHIEKKAWDGDGVPLEDSNVANIGSAEDKALRKSVAASEPAWEGIGLEPGLWIFRIESFKVVPWPKEKYGTFHEGDSYIILQAQVDEPDEGEAEDNTKLERDIFFWLGKKTSTDEKGTAAYKTVELDDFFDGEPVQHREVQGRESPEFKELFPKGLLYLSGGVESGFHVVQSDVFVNKLYQVRRDYSKKNILIEEEQCSKDMLNHRDAFILDTGKKIYTWFGDECSPFLKNAANMKAENMEAERDGNSTVYNEVDADFWRALGGEGTTITAADAVGEEVEADFGEGVLYSVNVNEERQLEVKEVGRGELHYEMLDPTAVMMVDTRSEIFMWLGKDASEIEKRSAFKTASNYLKMNSRDPNTTSIVVLKQGHGRKNKTWRKMFH